MDQDNKVNGEKKNRLIAIFRSMTEYRRLSQLTRKEYNQHQQQMVKEAIQRTRSTKKQKQQRWTRLDVIEEEEESEQDRVHPVNQNSETSGNSRTMQDKNDATTPRLTLRQKLQQLQDRTTTTKKANKVTNSTYAQITYHRNLEGAPATETTSSTTIFETYDPTTSTTKTKEENPVINRTYAQMTYPRNLESTPTTAATSSTTIFKNHDPTTSTSGDKEKSTLFGTQVRPPREEHPPTVAQAGMAAPPKHTNRADTGFVGDHTKPPVRPPSSGEGMSPSRVFVEVETSHRLEWHAKETAKTDPQFDIEAALAALLRRPPPSPAPIEVERKPEMLKMSVIPPYPTTEINQLDDKPPAPGPTITGKTVETGDATSQWQGAHSRAKRKESKGPRFDESAPVVLLRRDSPPSQHAVTIGALLKPPEVSQVAAPRESKAMESQLSQADFERFLENSSVTRMLKHPPPQAPPSAQAEGPGNADVSARSAQDAEKRPRRRVKRPTKVADEPQSPVSPRSDTVLSGNPFAPLADLAEETHTPCPPPHTTVLPDARCVLASRKPQPSAADRPSKRKAITLGDFMPPGAVARKRTRKRRQQKTLRLEGIAGPVSSRVPLWSDRNQLTEMPPVPVGSHLRARDIHLGHGETLSCSLNSALSSPKKRRRRPFAGLRGIVSNHYPTFTVRPYRPWKKPAVLTSGPTRPVVPPPRPLPPAVPRGSIQAPAPVHRTQPSAQRASPTPPTPQHRSTSTSTGPTRRAAPVKAALSPPPPEPSEAAATSSISTGRPAPTSTKVNPPDVVRLTGTYRSAWLSVMVESKDWESCPHADTADAGRWVLSNAIQGKYPTPPGQQRPPIHIIWWREGKRLARIHSPTDQASLARLMRTGWEFEATTGLRGGMDNAQAAAGDNPSRPAPALAQPVTINFDNMDTNDYQLLDAVIRDAMAGRFDEGNPLTSAAREMLASVQPEYWATLTEPILGEISPARILSLRYIAHDRISRLRERTLAPWLEAESVVGIRFCDVQPGLSGWTGGPMTAAKQVIMQALMRIDGLGTATNFDWQTMRSNIRVEGELSSNGVASMWTVQAVIPQGPWIRALLTGAIALIPGSYAVPLPNGTHVEVPLDPTSTRVLKGLGPLLGLDGDAFRGLVRYAFAQCLRADMIGVRITTSAFTHGVDGKKGKTTFFPADHPDSKIMVGVEATLLLHAGRIGPTLSLKLGCGAATPVTILASCPEVPAFALNKMRTIPGTPAARYRWPGAAPDSRDVVIGYVIPGVDVQQTGAHLPAGWLSEKLADGAAKRAWALQLMRQAFQREAGATTMLPVGRLKKGGGDPAYLFVMFPTVEIATQFCTLVDSGSLPPAMKSVLNKFLNESGNLATFCAYIPPESIEMCVEKDIVPLFKTALTEANIIRPAAPPNARV